MMGCLPDQFEAKVCDANNVGGRKATNPLPVPLQPVVLHA